MENITNALLYEVKSSKALRKAATMILDGKNDTVIFCHGLAHHVSGTGAYLEDPQPAAVHPDAVEIWPGMTEKEQKAAHSKAAGRRTCRIKEEAAADLLARKESLTAAERLALLALVNVAYHGSGKIEGCYSVDGCAACEFCQKMIAASACNPLMICRYCYAAADSWKEYAWRQHKTNARILSSVLFTAAELAALAIDGPRCRFNEDGDTVNQTHGQNLLRIASTRPGTHFGYWYKNAPAVEAALHAEGIHSRDALPDNVRFIHSSALIGIRVRRCWFDDATFTVYPDDATTAAAIAGGAWECNGRRCRACGYHCYLAARQPEAIDIAEYLRCGKTERAAIVAALDAWQARQAERLA